MTAFGLLFSDFEVYVNNKDLPKMKQDERRKSLTGQV